MKGIGNFPAESKIFKKSKGKFTTFISVLTERWAKEFYLSTPVLQDSPRSVCYIYYWGNKVYFKEWITALPYNFIIDRDGKIFWKKKRYYPTKLERKV